MIDGLNHFPEDLNNVNVIILGTFPGEESLKEPKQYYKKKTNQFWKLIGCNETDYEKRKDYLIGKKIGIWDIFGKCKRVGINGQPSSKDNDIIEGEFNNLKQLPESKILFNGKSAYSFFLIYKKNNFIKTYNKDRDYKEYKKIKSSSGKLDETKLPVLPSSSGGRNYYSKDKIELIWKNKIRSINQNENS